jgi:hypothetical protein
MKKLLLIITLFLSGCYTGWYNDDVYYRNNSVDVIVHTNYHLPNYGFYRYQYPMFWTDFSYWGSPFMYGYDWRYYGHWGNYWTPYYRYSDFFWTRPHWTPIVVRPIPTQQPNRPIQSAPRTGNTRSYYPSGGNVNRPANTRATRPNSEYQRETPTQISQPRYQRTPTQTQPRYTPQTRQPQIPQTEIRTRNSGGGRGNP